MISKRGILAAAILFVGGCSSSASNFATADSDAGAKNADSGSFFDAGAIESADSGTSDDAGASATCGLRAGTRGLSSRSVTVNGATRTYLVYLLRPSTRRSRSRSCSCSTAT